MRRKPRPVRSKQCRTPRKIRCLGTFFEMASATGCHRGEVLALRWCDIRNDAAFVDRSLCQTRDGLTFKSTTTETPRRIELPPARMPLLARHRERQDEFRRQYGPGYRSDLDLIIANPDGTPLKPDSVSETVSRLCRMLGLPKGASLHTVRHSHASLLLEKASTSRPSANASATRRWPRPPPSTATRSAARTAPRPRFGTTSCSRRAQRNPGP